MFADLSRCIFCRLKIERASRGRSHGCKGENRQKSYPNFVGEMFLGTRGAFEVFVPVDIDKAEGPLDSFTAARCRNFRRDDKCIIEHNSVYRVRVQFDIEHVRRRDVVTSGVSRIFSGRSDQLHITLVKKNPHNSNNAFDLKKKKLSLKFWNHKLYPPLN